MSGFDKLDQAELTAKLDQASRQYYQSAEPTLTDVEYDWGLRRLQEMEDESGLIYPGSPTRIVGSDLTGNFKKVKHRTRMLSLDNKFTVEDLLSFLGTDYQICIEPKLDGASLDLEYEDGQLVMAKTRGDGTYGEVVTDNARTITGIPLAVSEKRRFSVRGEVVMRRSVLKEINAQREAEGEEPYANCRNTAAAGLKLKSPAECATRRLNFMAYWTDHNDYVSHAERIQMLSDLGFHTVRNLFGEVFSPAGLPSPDHSFEDIPIWLEGIKSSRDGLDVDIDGCVAKIDDTRAWAELGEGNKSPKWAVAFKFPEETVYTTLLGIVVQIGRTGQVTPVAQIKPVQVGGVTVTSVSLMNADEMEKIGGPAPGDEVGVIRSAAVIPRIICVRNRNSGDDTCWQVPPWKIPETCPYCSVLLVRDGVHWFDNNPFCPERVKAYLKYATSKETLDWDGMGDVAIARLHESGVSTLADLFTCDLTQVFTGAELKKITAERERVKTAPLWRKLKALGAEDCGTTHCKTLAQRYGSLQAICDGADLFDGADADKSDLAHAIGDVAAENFMLRVDDLFEVIRVLIGQGFIFEDDMDTGPQPLKGLTFCITGTLRCERDEMVAKIENMGGVVKSSCTKNSTHCVVGELPGATKISAAVKYGIPQINEAELYALMGESMPDLPVISDEDSEV